MQTKLGNMVEAWTCARSTRMRGFAIGADFAFCREVSLSSHSRWARPVLFEVFITINVRAFLHNPLHTLLFYNLSIGNYRFTLMHYGCV